MATAGQENVAIFDHSLNGSIIENTCFVNSKDEVKVGELTEATAGAV